MTYTPTNWRDGDTITAARMNKLEQGVADQQGGAPGKDGFSPTVSVAEITGGHRVTITDANGPQIFDVMDGISSGTGGSGTPGKDGVSPIVTVTNIANGHRVSITDANGTKTFDVLNGADGATGPRGLKGDKGDKGDPGDTPHIGANGNWWIGATDTGVSAAGGGSTGEAGGGSVPDGTIVIWFGDISSIPIGWRLCDGTNGTPDLRGRFVLGAGGAYSPGGTGGEESVTLTVDNIPSHAHRYRKVIDTVKVAKTTSTGEFVYVQGLDYVDSDTTGGGESHNNMPPYYALCYIMKVSSGSSSSRLPDGYTELEYFEANGGYFWTGQAPTESLKLVADIETLDSQVTRLQRFFAATTPSYEFNLSLTASDIKGTLGGTSSGTKTIVSDNSAKRRRVGVDCKTRTMFVDDTEVQFSASAILPTTRFISIMSDGANYLLHGRFYSCQMYTGDEETMIRDFVPCIDPSGVIGAYDLVGGTFYENIGSVDFVAGPAV